MATISKQLFDFLPEFSADGSGSDQRDTIESLLKKALDAPLNYPPLAESIFPGDRVAILIQNALPAAVETLESLICVLEKLRIETSDIIIVVPTAMKSTFDLVENSDADPESIMPATWRMKSDDRQAPLLFELHAIDDDQAVSYLAANVQGDPVYVNRTLCDSDVILPLSYRTPNKKQSDCLYPEFSTGETRQRFRKKKDSASQRTQETELANDSLGLFFSIELICRPGDAIEEVVCGSRAEARKVALEKLEPLWILHADDDCDAVITTIESTPESTTWANIIRAVNSAATHVVDGPIIVWSELSEKPNAKVKAACSAQFDGSVPDSLSKKLQHFASILCERPVYLKSRLSQNVVEGLGLGFVESAESVERIMRSHGKPLLIRDGHLREIANRE